MNVKNLFKTAVSSVSICLLFFGTLSASAQSQGIWKGPSITFTKADLADWTQAANQDRLSDSVWLTRQDTKSIFNIKANSGYVAGSPKGTLWSMGTTADIATLTFAEWTTAVNNKPNNAINKDMVLFLEHDSIYIDIKFTSWSGGGPGGGFEYIRSTDCRSYGSITETACNSYTSPSGKVWTVSGMYQDTVSNDQGCDSIISIDLTINSVNVNVTTNGDTIMTQESDARYQWLDCPNFGIVSGETNSSFITLKSGEYAVEITKTGCVDTSDCVSVQNSSVGSLNAAKLTIYPNPSNGSVTISLENGSEQLTIQQFDLFGKLVSTSTYNNQSHIDFELVGETGTYILSISDSSKVTQNHLIIKQ